VGKWVGERATLSDSGVFASRKATLSSGATARVRAPAEEARLGWRRYVKTSPLTHTHTFSLQIPSLNRVEKISSTHKVSFIHQIFLGFSL